MGNPLYDDHDDDNDSDDDGDACDYQVGHAWNATIPHLSVNPPVTNILLFTGNLQYTHSVNSFTSRCILMLHLRGAI